MNPLPANIARCCGNKVCPNIPVPKTDVPNADGDANEPKSISVG